MRGKHRVIVSTKRLKYDFELRRNLTIIRGDSATGKTTLADMPWSWAIRRGCCGLPELFPDAQRVRRGAA